MARGTALSDYTVPTLFAALITSALTQIAFMADLYSGALYRPQIGRVLMLVLFSPIIAIPSLIFGMLVVWPTVLILAFLAGSGAERAPTRYRLPTWLVLGALAGMPVLYGYSLMLGWGQARIGHLLINGAVCGIGCATLVYRFLGPDIDDIAAGFDDESADTGA
jgi:hypothetical protein